MLFKILKLYTKKLQDPALIHYYFAYHRNHHPFYLHFEKFSHSFDDDPYDSCVETVFKI